MISIHSLNKRFGKLQALKDIELEFVSGQLISLIGPNGSGKTTLIKSILGLVLPDSGQILIQNIDIRNNDLYRSDIGYMPQMGRFPENMKVGQLFQLLKSIRPNAPHQLDEDLYHEYHLEELLPKTLRTLSGGTRQKVNATIAFLFNPKILILDEPTAGLDPIASEILKKKIREESKKGKLILITSHVLSDIEDITTHVAYMQEGGVLYYGPIDELRLQTGEKKLGPAIAHLMKQNSPLPLHSNPHN